MRYGSVNEKTALRRFHEYVAEYLPTADMPVYVDEPGIWISPVKPYLAGSPDGVVYETLGVSHNLVPGEGRRYHCRRSLLEIKTPYKLLRRRKGGEFYPVSRLPSVPAQRARIPPAYFDQIQPRFLSVLRQRGACGRETCT
jgi:hypothetical protein